jgi:hypothetical protein
MRHGIPPHQSSQQQWQGSPVATTDEDDAAIERELDMLMTRIGAKVPADRRAGVIAGYKDMKRMTVLLRQPRTAAAEPSNIYSLVPYVRSTRA